ncbi:hypothetical protein KY290_007519 [Solanum tuberosum]|uniref:Uncharacterized protein n=1 Tax=Solanum tuberosum TaxID=4113 RepID=A0ABQ7W5T5_SOLTU|nr:hypothetical protein KY290_007519 [Solanum tuberosum]
MKLKKKNKKKMKLLMMMGSKLRILKANGLKCHSPSKKIPEFTIKKQPRRRKKGEAQQVRSRYTKEAQGVPVLTLGHDIYELTVKYLLAPLSAKTNNLFVFSWDFMAWAFEVIPHLMHQVTTTEEEISSPKILRWLRAKNVYHAPDIFNPPHDADDMVDAVVRAGVNIGVGVGVDVGAGVGFGVQSVGATSCSRCTDFLCEKCKKHDEDSLMYLKTLSHDVNEFKNKRAGSRSFHQRMFGIHILYRPREEKNPLSRQYKI